jgi:DNA-binding IclR family transcriptional regulator
MHCSALGKAYLSALPRGELEHELDHLSYAEGTPRAPRNAAELQREIDRSTERGFAFDLGETIESAHCVAIPVRFSGTLWGAAGVQGPAGRLSEERLTEIGHELIRRFGPFDRLASAGLPLSDGS